MKRAIVIWIATIGIILAGGETPDRFWPWVNLAGIFLILIAGVMARRA